ncbi:peptide-N(4)-(N-acetyl-beta-glucosaminyl)asparagine amidase-like [Varroa jacobsoni]|uniref:peptide-N(4)-(N-acetyl-beta- glucosaminyl)asparagine amidase-like n=1 Tax=Varroa jacobsoni TaxID=62625 RepID=UPI000BF7D0DC|nr:peptide-N(4)-(N-acetyl-beta-glucosaminyl)asparagine amidase-like [Varroa jacobsoni]
MSKNGVEDIIEAMAILLMDWNHPLLRQLDGLHEVPLRYEDEETRVMAESLVPIDELQARVATQYAPPELERDLLLIEIVQWFKREFFSWVDNPKCDSCSEKTKVEHIVSPDDICLTSEEKEGLARRIELYRCTACKRELRFPRYNCPRKLLETRSGRCGEWANAFTLICLALGYEARYVWDVTDHVWTEVWSDAKNRWVHCDPCEAACDAPLTYEQGWGKQLSYIFAFTSFETVDVTWRYVTNFKETLARRRSLPEAILIKYQDIRNEAFQRPLSPVHKEKLKKRRIMELTEFLAPPKVRGIAELQGRISGDEAWRLGRKETDNTRIIRNSRPDVRTMEITYSSASDIYVIEEDGDVVEKTYGWASMMQSHLDIIRKEELDWKMAYLARRPGSSLGVMQYKIELSRACRVVEVTFIRETFENGEVAVNLSTGEDNSLCIRGNDPVTFSLPPDSGYNLVLTCELSGGQGDNAWQHAQAFRQALSTDAMAPTNSTSSAFSIHRASGKQQRIENHRQHSPTLKLRLFF